MIKIRWNTFESNSSSSHVVTIGKDLNGISRDKIYNIDFYVGDYGWEVDCVSLDSYFYTSLCMGLDGNYDKLPEVIENIKNALSKYANVEITYEVPENDYDYWGNRGIDHEGVTYLAWEVIDSDSFEVKDDYLLARMLLSSDSAVYTGNDNDSCCDPRCGIVGSGESDDDEEDYNDPFSDYRYKIDKELVYIE